MGDGANEALRSWIRGGMVGGPKRKRVPRVTCSDCGKEVYGQAGLMQHINSKHDPKRYTWAEICNTRDNERYDLT